MRAEQKVDWRGLGELLEDGPRDTRRAYPSHPTYLSSACWSHDHDAEFTHLGCGRGDVRGDTVANVLRKGKAATDRLESRMGACARQRVSQVNRWWVRLLPPQYLR